MTIVWIGLIVLGIILVIAAFTVGDWLPFDDGPVYLCAGGIIVCLVGFICFFAVPVHGYMKVESTHWYWSVDIFTYQQVNKSDRTGHRSSKSSAERAAREDIPADAYNINIDTHSGFKTVVDREWKDEQGYTHKDTHTEYYYYATYSYTINRWIKTSEVSSCGRDKSPYEPERPFDTTVSDVLGNQKCGTGHNEEYKVTGYVNEEIVTYEVSKSDWEQIRDNDEFEYTKFRFGNEIWGLKLAR